LNDEPLEGAVTYRRVMEMEMKMFVECYQEIEVEARTRRKPHSKF